MLEQGGSFTELNRLSPTGPEEPSSLKSRLRLKIQNSFRRTSPASPTPPTSKCALAPALSVSDTNSKRYHGSQLLYARATVRSERKLETTVSHSDTRLI